MSGLPATFINASSFSVVNDLTNTFIIGRRIKADCGVDGFRFGTIISSVFGGGVTTVTLSPTSNALTSNLDVVWYGIVGGGAFDQSIPIHSHDGSEGSGGDIFGSFFAQSSSEAESTTTSTAFQQKVTLSVSGLIAGVYRLGWYAETRHSSIANDINLRIQQNNTTDLALTNIEPKDNSNYFPQSGFVYVTLAASTSYNFDMDYSTESGSSTSRIRRARLEFWKVG